MQGEKTPRPWYFVKWGSVKPAKSFNTQLAIQPKLQNQHPLISVIVGCKPRIAELAVVLGLMAVSKSVVYHLYLMLCTIVVLTQRHHATRCQWLMCQGRTSNFTAFTCDKYHAENYTIFQFSSCTNDADTTCFIQYTNQHCGGRWGS